MTFLLTLPQKGGIIWEKWWGTKQQQQLTSLMWNTQVIDTIYEVDCHHSGLPTQPCLAIQLHALRHMLRQWLGPDKVVSFNENFSLQGSYKMCFQGCLPNIHGLYKLISSQCDKPNRVDLIKLTLSNHFRIKVSYAGRSFRSISYRFGHILLSMEADNHWKEDYSMVTDYYYKMFSLQLLTHFKKRFQTMKDTIVHS